MTRDPGLADHPACSFAHTTHYYFQRGGKIIGRGHIHRDGLQKAQLLLRLLALLDERCEQ